ncbi:MAG: hypothetical protein WCZ18_11440 [Ottowia sp.]|nr:hypothetical protein [Ottowia sp.]
MNRNWLGLGLLAGAALLASAVWWTLARNDWQPPPAQLPQLPDVQALPVPETVAMRQALARPLLWPSRRPPEAPAAEPVEVDDEGGGELEDATLEAVLESGGQRLALLKTADGDIVKISADPTQAHNALPHWRLQQFDGTTAVFMRDDGQRMVRALNPTGAPQPKTDKAAKTDAASPRPSNRGERDTNDNSLRRPRNSMGDDRSRSRSRDRNRTSSEAEDSRG